jgi:hypothetical protein
MRIGRLAGAGVMGFIVASACATDNNGPELATTAQELTAAPQCVPIDSPAPPAADALVFSVEGKITAYDVAANSITANGMTFTLGPNVKISNVAPGVAGTLTLAQMTDPALEATRSIIGATVIADGTSTNALTAGKNCVSFTAATAYIEMAENTLLGVLHDITPANQTFHVNGTAVHMNADSRFPSSLLDLGGRAIPLAGLVGFEGTAVSLTGFMESGVFIATLAETSAVLRTGTGDAVAITKAQMRVGKEFRIDGQVAANAAGRLATTVSVFSNGACTGSALGSAAVAADATFSFRLKSTTLNVTNVCVKTSLGASASTVTTP